LHPISSVAEKILTNAARLEDVPVDHIIWGPHLIAVKGARIGLASRMFLHGQHAGRISKTPQKTALNLARTLPEAAGKNPETAALGLAAINSILRPPDNLPLIKAQDIIRTRGQGKRVAVIGHFPFVEKLNREFKSFHVLELDPGPSDTPAELAEKILPTADLVAITSTTIMNNTLDAILGLTAPQALVMLLGPSTPFAPGLFDLGVDILAGTTVADADIAINDILAGRPYRQLRGVESVLMSRAGLTL